MIAGPLSEEEYREVYSKVPKLCVDLVIAHKGGILLTLRDLPHWHNEWHLPGTAVRYKEPVLDAVQRTAQNELHMSVAVEKLLGYVEYPSEEKERGFGRSVALAFLCTPTSGFEVGESASDARIFEVIPDDMIAEQKEFVSAHWEEILQASET
jgi:ADP-ribose pyrophosphatase YjhB (NUDIX family)